LLRQQLAAAFGGWIGMDDLQHFHARTLFRVFHQSKTNTSKAATVLVAMPQANQGGA
jgi:hypothetical protein